MKEQHQIVNDFNLDAIKDNYNPPKMTDIRDDSVEHLLFLLNLSFDLFFQWVREYGEYHTDKGHNFFLTKDVATFIKSNLNPYAPTKHTRNL